MMIFDTFSKRQKKQEKQGQQDVYQYDVLPEKFRVQVIHIWRSALGQYEANYSRSPSARFWDLVHNTIAREHGLFLLGDQHDNPRERCQNYLMMADTSSALDIIDLSFRVIDRGVRELGPFDRQDAKIVEEPDDAIEELNHRFREHGIGYLFADGQLMRVDSQFLHSEAVKPALSLLNDAGFAGPKEEFLKAFDHYKNGNHKEAVAEALKSFESTMKAICAQRKWSHPSNATAKPLIDLLMDKGLIPKELENHFGGLRAAMESGLPTISNRTSRHGQGPQPIPIPPHFAAYALHLVATNIVFLVEAHKAKP